MARIDDYANALKIAAREVAVRDPFEIGRLASVDYDEEEKLFRLEFLGQAVEAGHREPRVTYTDDGREADLPEKVLIYHYLNQAKGVPLAGQDVAYRDIPGGEFYHQAFYKRAEAPMLKTFGQNPNLLASAAPKIKGQVIEGLGDAAARFFPLPRVPVTLIVWGGDDEFEPSGKILFDPSVKHYLTIEDTAWAASMVVYKLMRLAREE